jgi:hypothetical protein
MNFRTKGTILTIALSVAICGMPNFAWAGAESDPNLVKLENKFFQHDWPKDDLDTRLDRLEKLVFGEAKTGDDATRLKNLVSSVGNLDAPAESTAQSGSGAGSDNSVPDDSDKPAARSPKTASDPDSQAAEREQQISDGSQYPAVTAMEKKLFAGKDYASEPIVKRLERLETKVFGKPTQIADLSDRVDRLKSQTGVDLARTPPPGSDWADDEDQPAGGGSDITYIPPRRTGTPPSSSYNPEDDPMFNNSHSQPSRPSYGSAWSGGGGVAAGSGSYGGGSTAGADMGSTGPSGGYGYTPPRKVASAFPPSPGTSRGINLPPTAPDVVAGGSGPVPAMGLNQQVGLLENEVLGKTYTNEGLPTRLGRLEQAVFPGTKQAADMTLPDRVRRLLSQVPISQPGGPQLAQRSAGGAPQVAPDYENSQGVPPVAPQRGTGLGRIINGLGNLLMGGNMGMGAYPMSSTLVQDPSTGLLIDTMSGNMINPTTGQVVRQGVPSMGGYGAYNNGFNNGLSPIGSPYGMGNSGMRFGFGGSGIRFGGGGMGMGSGMGMGGMGVPGYPIGTQAWP